MTTPTSQQPPLEAVEQRLVGFELVALAHLLSAWARPERVDARSGQWPRRIPALRTAVLIGLKDEPGRVREKVPLEIVKDEVTIAAELVDWLAKNAAGAASSALEHRQVPLRVSNRKREVTVSKGLLASDAVHGRLRLWIDGAPGRGKPSRDELIGLLVGSRLPIAADTATKAPGKDRKFGDDIGPTAPHHRLLASLFLDLAWSGSNPDLQARALDALYTDRYHVLMLYYLVQLSHYPPTAPVGPVDVEGIRALCTLVGRGESGPFTELCRSECGPSG